MEWSAFLSEQAVKVTLTFSSLTDLTAAADMLRAAGLNDSDLIEIC
jgi:hypothetical protein